MPRLRTLALLALTLAAVLSSSASAVTAPRTAARPYFDLRSSTAATAPSATGAASARSALRRSLGRGAVLDVDRSTGTARRIAREGRAVTGSASGDRRAIAEHYIRQHADVIGLSEQDLGTLELDSRTASPGRVLYLRWRQSVGGIPLFDGGLRASVAADGRVVSIGGAPVRGLASAPTTPKLDSAEALRRAREDARAKAGGSDEDDASLVLYATGRDVRLAWATMVHTSSQATYHTLVDAESGTILHRQNLVKFAAPALMFDRYPGASPGGTQTSVDLEARGWLNPGSLNLTGPFARAYSDVNTNNSVNAGEEVTRASAAGNFAFSFTDFTPSNSAGGCSPTHQCSWNIEVGNSWQTNRSQTTVQAFAYVSAFRDHLAAAPIGFDAASGGFEGTDRVTVEADDGAAGPGGIPDVNHRDNANMETFPDGTPPRMQMYLFYNDGAASPFRDINGGDDAAIVYHEYTHGLSNRLITFSNGVGALDEGQSGAMGEAWSDFYAKDFLANQGLQPDTTTPGEVDMGEYTDSIPHSIRSQPLDCPVAVGTPACPGAGTAGPSGYTYGDYGHIRPTGGAEVHFDGEIWGETLWDLRTEVGSSVAEALITGGMRGSPTLPTFLQERDAIMDADVALFGGHHMAALWRVFARRGMGTNATTTGSNDINPQEGFAKPVDQAPIGTMSATPGNVAPGANVHFDAGAIQDVDGMVREYRWDFDGNGSTDRTTSTPATDFVYAAPGRFLAQVTALDDGLNMMQATANVVVAAPPPFVAPLPTVLARIVIGTRVTVDRRGRFGARVTFAQAARSGTAKLLVFRSNKRIGSGTARVVKGDSVRFRIKLTKAGLRALKKAKKFRISLRLQLPGSTTIVATKSLQLRAPKKR
jgi:extracellular elastinolytic metalloproteinase